MSASLQGNELPRVHIRPPGQASRALAERLRAVESRNVTHVSETWPVFWEEARGANVRDADGNVYLDLTGAFGVGLLGHGHRAVVEAVSRQSATLLHGMGDVHPPTVKLEFLERLRAIAPWTDARVLLSSTGSEAVEAGLKTALVATGKPGILAFDGAYHGLTLGSLSTTSRDLFRAPFGPRLYDGVAFAPFPDLTNDAADGRVVEQVEAILRGGAPNGDPIGAVIVEPVQGRAGIRVPPAGFMNRLSEIAHAAGALVIADEVFTGMGRCGSLLASERVGLQPDIVCLGKALGGGLPISACLARGEVMDAWPESAGEAIHTSTFLGHPLACAAGLAVLDAIETEDVCARAAALGKRLVADLTASVADALDEGTSSPREQLRASVRGLGLLIGIELTRAVDGAPAEGAAARVAEAALAEGVMVLPAGASGQVVELTPSVGLTDEQIACAVSALSRAIRAVAS